MEIIGIGCRFSGAICNVRDLWNRVNLRSTLIRDIPSDRFDSEPFLGNAGERGKSVTFRGGWLESVDRFDARRFSISPREAREMDPQQRLFLEVAFEALHDAGLNPDRLKGEKVGVYVGTGTAEHQAMSFSAVDDITQHTMSGNSLAVIANRLSYLLDVDGPSLAVDTACSAAMTAFCLACDALRAGNCDYAIVGGTNVMLSPSPFVGFSQARMLSPRGVCAPFDTTADGFVRGEGCGVVILRRDGDRTAFPSRTYATVAGYGANEDGRTASLTMPSERRQEALYSTVLADSGIAPEDVVFVEAHGTGTPVGDPIEARSISSAFVGDRSEALAIGSIKGHIGHLETAAGIAGIIKGALCLYHGALVPTAGHSTPPPDIDVDALRIRIPTGAEPLPEAPDGRSPVIAVCSYGFGGANGLALLSKAESLVSKQAPLGDAVVLPLSADTPDALAATRHAYQAIDRNDRMEAARWAGHCLPGRRVRTAALLSVSTDRDDLDWLAEQSVSKPPRVAFAFSGQGSHTATMGSMLTERFEAYRSALHEAADIYADVTGLHLVRDCSLAQADGLSEDRLQDVLVTVPALVLTQVAFVKLLLSAGVRPAMSFGHSVGEMTAAWAAGLIELDELCHLTALRAEAQSRMPAGAMAALMCRTEVANQLISSLGQASRTTIAAVNSADAITIAGSMHAVEAVIAAAETQRIAAIRLQVPKAYHSRDADIAASWLEQQLQLKPRNAPDTFASSTGDRAGNLSGCLIDSSHWAANIRNPVDFPGACVAAAPKTDIVLEIAPKPTIASHIRKTIDRKTLSVQHPRKLPDEALLTTIAELFVAGANVDFAHLQPPTRFVSVPHVPWDHSTPLRSSVWKTPDKAPETAPAQTAKSPIAVAHLAPSPSSGAKLVLAPSSHSYLEDHTVEGNPVLPGALMVVHALAACAARNLDDIRFERFVPLHAKEGMTQLHGGKTENRWHWHGPAGSVFSCVPGGSDDPPVSEIAARPVSDGTPLDIKRIYRVLSTSTGLGLNGPFRSIVSGRIEGSRLTSELKCSDKEHSQEAIACLLIDGAMQSLALIAGLDSWFFAPVSIDRIDVCNRDRWPEQAVAHAHLTALSGITASGNIILQGQDGTRLAQLSGVTLRKMRSSQARKPSLFCVDWHPCNMNSAVREGSDAALSGIFFAGSPAIGHGFETVASISDAAIVVDNREDINRAAELLSEVVQAPNQPAVVFLHRYEMAGSVSPMPGFARAARNEHPNIDIYSIGVAGEPDIASAVMTLLSGRFGRERELRARPDGWHMPRLRPQQALTSVAGADYRLDVSEPGQLQSLRWRPIRTDLEGLGPDEVRIRVTHVSLHFKDVMLALGLLPGFSPIVGMECAATIEAIGNAVPRFDPTLRPGQAVLALAMTTDAGHRRDALFGTVAVTAARNVFPRPNEIDPAHAAAFLGVYATAWHALIDTARLVPGETVLIHSAAGGVGQAAVQIAHRLGAKVLASAGNEKKRSMLAQQPGVSHVLDSHKPSEFVSKINEFTGGSGVNVALNSLAEEGLRQTLAALAPGGRHVEIGKRDILKNATLGLQLLKDNITFHSVHLDLLAKTHPERIRNLVSGCIDRLSLREADLIETTVFPADQVIDAFRLLGSGRHCGKIVVDVTDLPERLENPEGCANSSRHTIPRHLIPDALFANRETVLITGGLGGLGLALARFMAGRGAGRILLAGRSGVADELAALRINAIRDEFPDVQVDPIQLDAADEKAVVALVSAEPFLSGIVHAATAFEAGSVLSAGQNWDKTWNTKVGGAEALDRATRHRTMRFFVSIGSLAGLHGNTHQAAYVASNAALAAVAEQRRTAGFPALAIDLPILLGAGRLSDPRHVDELIFNTAKGFPAISFEDLVPLFEQIFTAPNRYPPHLVIDHPDWSSYLALNRNPALFEHLVPPGIQPCKPPQTDRQPDPEASPKAGPPHPSAATAAKPSPAPPQTSEKSMHESSLPTPTGNDDRDEITTEVFAKIGFVLGADIAEIDPDQPLIELGIDSLAATELNAWVDRTFGIQVSQSAFLTGLTGRALVETIRVNGANGTAAPAPALAASAAIGAVPISEGTPSYSNEAAAKAPASNQSPESIADAPAGAVKAIRAKLAFVLGVQPEEIDNDVPLTELGIDSLAATELAVWIAKTYQVEVSQTQFLSGIALSGIAGLIDKAANGTIAPASQNEAGTAVSAPPLDSWQPIPLDPLIPVQPANLSKPVSELHTGNPASQPTPNDAMADSNTADGYRDIALSTPRPFPTGHRVVHLPEYLSPDALEVLISEFDADDQVIVLRKSPDKQHFCLGMDLESVDFGSPEMSLGLERFRVLAEKIKAARMPVVCVVEGACRGGGMLFPSLATIVIASQDASFGLPEIRRGGLPGLVSVYAAERMQTAALRTMILTGETRSADDAKITGLVDIISLPAEIEAALTGILRRFATIEPGLLAEAQDFLPAETAASALIAMGGLDRRQRTRERDPEPLIRLRHNRDSGVAIITFADPDFSNAIDWAIGDDLSRAIETARGLDPLRAIVLEGEGEHFCVGVNPYNFIKRTKRLPLLTAARVTYDIYKAYVGIRELGVPVIAAVQGKLMGGGLAAILNADYRIATRDATFNYGNLPRGVCPGLLMSDNLPRAVGENWTAELYMNDYTLSADQAQDIGLVNRIAADTASARAEALAMAERIAGYGSLGVSETLGLIRPPVDYARLARESIGIARCNILGDAFAPGWKAAERRMGEAPVEPLTARQAKDSPTTNTWDWTSDVFLDVEPGAERSALSDPGASPVLLTGATGFLGAHILQSLLDDTDRRVICLVRGTDAAKATARLRQSLARYGLDTQSLGERVTVVTGDISQQDLGLDETTYRKLSQLCGAVIHNAACVDFTVSYDRLKSINVDGVRNVAAFAAAGVRSQLIHVSSLSVFSLHHFVGASTDLRPDPARLVNGYSRSKWVGEQIALAAGRGGLNVSVVRPGRIMGNSVTGASNPEDWFTRYLQTSIAIGKAWSIEHETDMTPVDAVARLVVSRLGKQAGEPRTWHAISSKVLRTGDINRALIHNGYPVEPVSFDRWMDEAEQFSQQGMGPLTETFRALPGVAETPTKLQFSTDLPEHDEPDGGPLLQKMLSWLSAKGLLPDAPSNGTRTGETNGTSATRPLHVAEPANGSGSRAKAVGIHAMELYFPQHAVTQADMERHHQCPGKYTAGLGQAAITFCGEDEDAVSMALTAVHRLIERSGIGWDRIGRLEVGTESLLDRSKSVKTHLMALFGLHGQHDIEGVDAYNACYGGTAALFNAVSWCQSEAWDGRYAIVVAVDIADLDGHQAFLNGAACVAMLIGPDAPVVMEPARASHMMHTWDFYKPVGWKDPFPLMRDGAHSIDVYLACLTGCYQKLSERRGINILHHHDHLVFHCTSTYLCNRAFNHLAKLARPDISLKERQALYREKTEPSTHLTRQIGSTYTASCYVNLYSLLAGLGMSAKGRNILMFSYGSGAASSMFSLTVRDRPNMDTDLEARLAARIFHSPDQFLSIAAAYSAGYARFDYRPKSHTPQPDGVYLLAGVDAFGIRDYGRQVDGRLTALMPDMTPAPNDMRFEDLEGVGVG